MRWLLTLLFCMFAGQARAEGAIAVGRTANGGYYYSASVDHSTRQQALAAAMANCNQHAYNCANWGYFTRTCYAVAFGYRGGIQTASGSTRADAEANALFSCKRAFGRCYLSNAGCDTISEVMIEQERQARELEAQRQEERAAEQRRLQQEAEQRSANLERERAARDTVQSAPVVVTVNETAAISPSADSAQNGYYQRVLNQARATQQDLLQSLRAADRDKLIGLLTFLGFCGLIAYVARLASAVPAASRVPDTSSIARPPPLPTGVQNTQAAQQALELAHSYLQELDDLVPKVIGEPLLASTMLNTLSLASRQIAAAEKADPSAMLTVEQDGRIATFSINELKSQALFVEAIARGADNPKRAIPILEKAAALAPTSPLNYFWLGNFHGLLHNKRQAVEAYAKAVALEPKNLAYRKELDRAQNMAWSEIAVAKSFRGARTAANAARVGAVMIVLGIIAGVFMAYGPDKVFFVILCIVVLGIGAKIREWASR